ncbi:MAG: hypothetical protein LBF06_19540 [Pseudomonas sp.]|jgi:hypothetical protein|nr:hypothetical protein [Pseudomonas sp.]
MRSVHDADKVNGCVQMVITKNGQAFANTEDFNVCWLSNGIFGAGKQDETGKLVNFMICGDPNRLRSGKYEVIAGEDPSIPGKPFTDFGFAGVPVRSSGGNGYFEVKDLVPAPPLPALRLEATSDISFLHGLDTYRIVTTFSLRS